MFHRLGSWFGPQKQESSIDHNLPVFASEAAKPKSELDLECYVLMRQVINAVEYSDFLDADKLWKQLCQLCTSNNITPQSLLGPNVPRLTLLEEILKSKDSKLGLFFANRIPHGDYSQNRVLNEKRGLFTMHNGKPNGPAFCKITNGGFYTGGIKGDKFDGPGKISYPYGDVYEGSWAEGVTITATSWRAEKGSLAAHLYGSKKRLGGGPNSICDTSVGLLNANK